MKRKLIKFRFKTPAHAISYINDTYPELKGKCFYDYQRQCLASLDKDYDFDYDYLHGVLEIKMHEIR